MTGFHRKPERTPLWFTAILVAVALPTFCFIPQASRIVEEAEWLGSGYTGWIYPLCIAFTCIFAWMCYPDRRTLSWILAGVVTLLDLGLFISVCMNTATP